MESKNAWDEVADEYCRRHGDEGSYTDQEYVLPAMMEMVGQVKGKAALDLGCGPGYLTRRLARAGAKTTGVDLSEELLETARKIESDKPLGIRYLRLDAANLEGIRDESFDLVTANMAFLAIKDARCAIRECGRILRPGGRLVFSNKHPVTDTAEVSDYGRDSKGAYIRLRKYGREHETGHRGFRFTHLPNYHRPFGFYMNELFKNGFVVSGCNELPIKHVNRLVGLPELMRPAILAGSAVAPKMFSNSFRPEKTSDHRVLGRLAEFPLFLIMEAIKKK